MKTFQLKAFIISVVLTFSGISHASDDHQTHLNHPAPAGSLELMVYKNANCGCCKKWISHLQQQGFKIKSQSSSQMSAIKDKFAVPKQYRSCHTAVSLGGYVFEGHIPAKIMQRFLNEKPANALGLAVPGMPVGSPGMEVEDKFMPYQVLLLNKDGSTSVYANINQQALQY